MSQGQAELPQAASQPCLQPTQVNTHPSAQAGSPPPSVPAAAVVPTQVTTLSFTLELHSLLTEIFIFFIYLYFLEL